MEVVTREDQPQAPEQRMEAMEAMASESAIHLGSHFNDFILECVNMCLRIYFLHSFTSVDFKNINTNVGVSTYLNCVNYYCYF